MAPAERDRLSRVYTEYSENAAKQRAWSAENPGNQAIRGELEAAVDDVLGPTWGRADRLLDAGCGTGWWLERMAARAHPEAAIVGVDLLPERVAAARRRVRGAEVAVADLRALPYPDGGFDVVFLWTALSSMPDRESVGRALAEAVRVLAPGGTVLVWEPRVPNPRNRALTFVARAQLREALGGALRERSLTVLPPLARRLGRGTGAVYPWLARAPLLRTHRLVWARPG